MPKIHITNLEIHLSRPAPALDGFRICHYTDLHTTRIGKVESNLMEVLASVDADIAVFTGDLTSGSNDVHACIDIMLSMKPRLGTFVVYGNNDHNKGVDLSLVNRLLRKNGINVLQNSSVFLPEPGVWVAGVDDPFTEYDDIAKASRDVPKDGPSILLAHSVEIMPKAINAQYDLVLAGHTHGGQINLPGGKAIWGHSCYRTRLAQGYFTPERLRQRGLDRAAHTHLFVNRGIGTSLLPIRLFCPPEVALITLRSR